MNHLALTIGATVNVYDIDHVHHAIQQAEGQHAAPLLRAYNKMLAAGPERFVTKPVSSQALAPLASLCPNFHGVVEDLANYVELALFGKGSLNIMPVLLAGDPGVGKTHFAKALAKALSVPYHFVSMGTLSAGWVLSGSAPTWAGARYGKIAQAMIEERFGNPLFLLDEIDKTGGDARHDPYGALLQLMEKETARHFRDEFLDVEIDTSAILWVATANDLSRIPDYILSRMAVYEVPRPTPGEAAVIAQNIYSALLVENGWAFAPTLSTPVIERMADIAPREMKKTLLDAMGAACRAKRDELQVQDVRATHVKQTRPIGF